MRTRSAEFLSQLIHNTGSIIQISRVRLSLLAAVGASVACILGELEFLLPLGGKQVNSCQIWFHVDKLSSADVYLRMDQGQTIDMISPEDMEIALSL